MAIVRARVAERGRTAGRRPRRVADLRDDLAIVGHLLARAPSALKQQPFGKPCMDGQIEAVPVVVLVAEYPRIGPQLAHLADLRRVEVVQPANLLPSAARQARIDRGRY